MEIRSRYFAKLTWPEIKEAVDNNIGIILPIGSTEQHGYHLPLETDSVLATDLAIEVAEETYMLVAPPVTYGYRSRPATGGGQTFVGTTSLGGRTLIDVIKDILKEFIRHGFKRIVLLNWHMENQNFIYEAAYEVMEQIALSDVKVMVMESAFENLNPDTMNFIFPDAFPGWGTEHAAIFETSLMLHLHPDDVLFNRAVDDEAEEMVWYDILPIQQEKVAKSGSLWKATQASVEKGKVGWEEVVSQVKTAILQELPNRTRIKNGG